MTRGAKENVRSDAHTSFTQAFFDVFKRDMTGVYRRRCLLEFEFRYDNLVALRGNDIEWADEIVASIVGKRLTYETVDG